MAKGGNDLSAGQSCRLAEFDLRKAPEYNDYGLRRKHRKVLQVAGHKTVGPVGRGTFHDHVDVRIGAAGWRAPTLPSYPLREPSQRRRDDGFVRLGLVHYVVMIERRVGSFSRRNNRAVCEATIVT